MAKHNKNSNNGEDLKSKQDQTNPQDQDETTENNGTTAESAEKEEETGEVQTKKYTELNDKYLRLYSDFDNYRKRVIKEKIEMSKTASEDVIISMLVILDDFERALGALEVTDEDPMKEGVTLIYNKFKSLLVQKGLADIEAMGEIFDTDLHEAVANMPAPSKDMVNKIIDVTQKGYTLNGKVIRFAKVVVAG